MIKRSYVFSALGYSVLFLIFPEKQNKTKPESYTWEKETILKKEIHNFLKATEDQVCPKYRERHCCLLTAIYIPPLPLGRLRGQQ